MWLRLRRRRRLRFPPHCRRVRNHPHYLRHPCSIEEKIPEIAPEAVETTTQEDVAGPGEDLSATGTEAREALIDEVKDVESVPKAAKAPIDEEITAESAPEACEAPIEEEKAAPTEVPDVVESAAPEAPIGEEKDTGGYSIVFLLCTYDCLIHLLLQWKLCF